jgi:hypothetical protein
MPHGESGYMIPSDQQERLRELLGLDMGSLSPGPSDEDGKIGGIRAESLKTQIARLKEEMAELQIKGMPR